MGSTEDPEVPSNHKKVTFNEHLAFYEEVRSAKMRNRTRHRKEKEEEKEVELPPESVSVPESKRAITYQVCSHTFSIIVI